MPENNCHALNTGKSKPWIGSNGFAFVKCGHSCQGPQKTNWQNHYQHKSAVKSQFAVRIMFMGLMNKRCWGEIAPLAFTAIVFGYFG